jgi:membrane-bound ClpP family serine protease
MTLLGIVLVLIGAALLVAEAHLPTYGVLGGLGAVMLVIGAVVAIEAAGAGLAVALAAGTAGGLAAGGFVAVAAHKGAATRRRRVTSGAEGLVGHMGIARSWNGAEGQVYVDGALWRACRSAVEDGDLRDGDPVVVEGVHGLTLSVRRAEEWELVR